jgi:hypothetical protein
MRKKSIVEEMSNIEALTLGDRGRKPNRKKSAWPISRDKSNTRHGRMTCYHCGKLCHVIKYWRILKREKKEANNSSNK